MPIATKRADCRDCGANTFPQTHTSCAFLLAFLCAAATPFTAGLSLLGTAAVLWL